MKATILSGLLLLVSSGWVQAQTERTTSSQPGDPNCDEVQKVLSRSGQTRAERGTNVANAYIPEPRGIEDIACLEDIFGSFNFGFSWFDPAATFDKLIKDTVDTACESVEHAIADGLRDLNSGVRLPYGLGGARVRADGGSGGSAGVTETRTDTSVEVGFGTGGTGDVGTTTGLDVTDPGPEIQREIDRKIRDALIQ